MSESTTPDATPGAAAVPPAAPASPAPPAGNPSAGGAPNDWRASLPAELREAPSLANFADPAALAKAHVEAQALIGRKGLIVPKEGDAPEVVAAYRTALGVPEKPEGYALAAPEGVPADAWDGQRATAFAAEAHKLGLTPQQAKGIAEWAAKDTATALQRFTAGIEADGRPMEEVLRGEFGQQYEVQVDRAKRAAREFGDDAALTALEAKIGGAALVRMFAKIGAKIAEDTPAGMGTGRGAGTLDPKAEREKLMEVGSPYWQPLHPKHAETMARVRHLFAAEAPS